MRRGGNAGAGEGNRTARAALATPRERARVRYVGHQAHRLLQGGGANLKDWDDQLEPAVMTADKLMEEADKA